MEAAVYWASDRASVYESRHTTLEDQYSCAIFSHHISALSIYPIILILVSSSIFALCVSGRVDWFCWKDMKCGSIISEIASAPAPNKLGQVHRFASGIESSRNDATSRA